MILLTSEQPIPQKSEEIPASLGTQLVTYGKEYQRNPNNQDRFQAREIPQASSYLGNLWNVLAVSNSW